MIENIVVRNEASYSDQGQSLDELSNNNFFYGANGSGKTTISRVIDDVSSFPDCTIAWRGGIEIETFVYNKDFVDKNFNSSSELRGIFTLGETNPETIKKIEDTNAEIENLDDDIRSRRKTLYGEDNNGGKVKERENLETAFEEKCWSYKLKYDEDFKDAFAGLRNSRTRFKERLKNEATENQSSTLKLEVLKSKAKTVFSQTLEVTPLLPVVSIADVVSLENSSVLSKKIVGRDDIDIAALIKKLNNSDWVKEGIQHLEHSEEKCPFCQQNIEQKLHDNLALYFDETYQSDLDDISSLHTSYSSYSQSVLDTLTQILEASPEHLNSEKLQPLFDLLDTKISTNIKHIERKQKEPSAAVKLEALESTLNEVEELITSANDAIKNHNNLIDNIEREKASLTSQIWRYICDEINLDHEIYEKSADDLDKAISGLKQGISSKQAERATKDALRQQLEKEITSVQPTIDHINGLLKSFGFVGFALDQSEQNGFYKIVRSDGSEVQDTLSEGEKTFITFLYFYHLLKGSNTADSITKPRVVVFDDPVSSLDSDILFIVSNLIKGIFEEIRQGVGNIKQGFVLTHNVFFHKEVSFNTKRSSGVMSEETFWVVKKNNQETYIEKQTDNPILNSYELLWRELKSENISELTIQNTLRRILENYFKILGNINKDELIDMLEDEDKIICSSLFSWINDGSHFVNDDLYICTGDVTVQKYLEVFKGIFQESGHIEHYNMMMGDHTFPLADSETNDSLQPNS